MSAVGKDAAIKNKELIKTILKLKPRAGDKGTKVSSLPKNKGEKPKKSTASKIKKFTDIFEKDDDTSYDTYEDIISKDDFGTIDNLYPSGSGSFTSGFEGFDASGGFKKGGRLKKTKKKTVRKRAALRGQRSELRGS